MGAGHRPRYHQILNTYIFKNLISKFKPNFMATETFPLSHRCTVTNQRVQFTKDHVSKKITTAGIIEYIKNAYWRNNTHINFEEHETESH